LKHTLADFLSDLRAELAEASRRAEKESLKLGVEEVTVSLDVAVTLAKKGEASAKFWVFASAEAGVKGERSSQQVATQHLTLTLKPRTEEVVIDETGKAHLIRRGVDVTGAIAAAEERPDLPAPKPDEQ
jgi:hypothetical protein